MDSSSKPTFLLPVALIFFFLCFEPTLAVAAATATNPTLNYTNLIYNHCPNKTPTIPSSSLSSLFKQLIAQSSQSKFFETIVAHENKAISGLFQCRGDLNFQDCVKCVNRVGKLSNTLCANTVPARIQLSGCYVRYEEADNGAVDSRFELVHKNCGEWKEGYGGFREKRDVGFEEVISCVGSNSDGFCETKVEEMRVMAQCEGKLRGCECGECVNNAVEVAKEECKDSVSAQIYVEGCFVSYSYDYYSHGEHEKEHREKGTVGGSTGKLVAMVAGGAAALSLVLALWYSIKNCGKKADDDW